MSVENPNIIDHVPTQAELEASKPSGDAVNFRDPAQQAEFNAAKADLGLAPTPAPREMPASQPANPEMTFKQSGEAPYVQPDIERRRSPEEMRQLRQELGITATPK